MEISLNDVNAVDRELAMLRELVDVHVRTVIQWYQEHKARPRRLYRLSVVLTITAGATLPLVASFDGEISRLTSGLLGVLVASIAGLNSAYKWDRTWETFTTAQTHLENAVAQWELQLALVTAGSQPVTAARAATSNLLTKTEQIRRDELERFFTRAGPEISSPDSRMTPAAGS